ALELGEDDGHLRDAAVRDVTLLAAEDVRVAVAACGGAHRLQVRARVRLGEGDRRQTAVLGGEPRQPALALLLGAETEQRPDGEDRRLDRRGEAGAPPRELFRDQRRGDRVDAAAAVLARDRVRGEPGAGRLREQLGRKLLPRRDRPELALGELVGERLQVALLRGAL